MRRQIRIRWRWSEVWIGVAVNRYSHTVIVDVGIGPVHVVYLACDSVGLRREYYGTAKGGES